MQEPPIRIQLKRTKGWRMPPNTVFVARRSRWGNPFLSWAVGGNATAVELFQDWIAYPERHPDKPSPPTLDEIRRALKGKNLACYCRPGEPCHADVLLELANAEAA